MSVSFHTMMELARERSPHQRHALLRVVADFFLATSDHAPAHFELYDEIMHLVLADVEPVARYELAGRLADLPAPPRRTLLRLADDDIEVARAVLMRSPALADDDLEPIARARTQEHLLAIAQRAALSERLTDILVERGDERVAGTVSANGGAHISARGFAHLAGRAADSAIILDALAMRRDLPERVATALLPLLQQGIRARIAAAKAVIDGAAERQMVDAARAALAERLRGPADPPRPLAVLMSLVARGELPFGEAATELADADRLVDLTALLGLRLDLRSETILRNLLGVGKARMMLICRAAGLDANAFSAVLRLTSRRKPTARGEPARLLREYLDITRDGAASIVRAVREREETRGVAP
jgi:Uncharacterised protein conserved in bacteria (DUF2336)